jgi:hypothetical protein
MRHPINVHFDPSGPMLHVVDDTLMIRDLNPEISVNWRLRRWEMFKISARMLLSALFWRSSL